MKIIQIMPEFGIAGAEIMCENLTYELLKLGHDVTVISMYDYHSDITERFENAGVDIRYLDKKRGLDFSMIWKMKRIFKGIGADVVHTHRYCAQYAMPAAILTGVKHRVHTVHNVAQKENNSFARKLNGFFFKHCHMIPVALSELLRETIVEEYGIGKERIPVIFNGIDLSKCRPKEDYSLGRIFKILHIGRFSEQKNHIGLLEAFQRFHSRHFNSELWLIGGGEKKDEIETYVKNNGLTDFVKFLGLQDNVYGYLHDADVFALPSLYEGIPMTLIEAMGTGLPIVATAVGGVPDLIDETSAILTNVNVDDIAGAFEKYYQSAGLRKTHGEMALKKANLFSVKAMTEKYLITYRKK